MEDDEISIKNIDKWKSKPSVKNQKSEVSINKWPWWLYYVYRIVVFVECRNV